MVPFEERVESHEERLNKQEERLNQHGKRLERHAEQLKEDNEDIQTLKERDKYKHVRFFDVEKKLCKNIKHRIKRKQRNACHDEGADKKLFNIVEQAMGYQESRTTQSYELRMAKLNTWSTVFLKVSAGLVGLLSSGGSIYYIIVEHVIK
ncbi:hypothetical protein [Sporosarcina sp. G11-34]|uniref:hypothetical protein n=1 Tax=Sporosarcina sp. G11-34 TaxID=2849605 RepID=UPI0022A966D7|nr:hypothetical protein [Sporosarcina sp. G11-34]MCZ2260614.1 hemolysin XhlA family protein [Sporosarcina sp. G11-34]